MNLWDLFYYFIAAALFALLTILFVASVAQKQYSISLLAVVGGGILLANILVFFRII